MGLITMGVEEEYLLLDTGTGLPVPKADQVLATAGLLSMTDEQEVQPELIQPQIEVATPVCTELDEVGGHLLRLRHAVSEAAARHGCHVAACGTPWHTGAAPPAVTSAPRYQAMRTQAPQLVAEQLINGMHVHVGIPDPETGVGVLNRIRLWLPVLVAMSVNSPFWAGHDTGFASWRTVVFGRWPVSGPPPYFRDHTEYEERLERLRSCGAILDTGQIYWQARLSHHYPTVEVRCFDVQPGAADAVLLAGVVRALVATAIGDVKDGVPVPDAPPELLQAATWHAARYGLSASLVDGEGRRQAAGDMVARLMDHIAPALDAAGDSREITALVHRLLRDGAPADRQREALARGGVRALTEMVLVESPAS
ncbi:carboxylate-amine ligase [Streptomyces minutiscleroticus]|uniref:Putative glutamate--cysteine ligase 2 n=1 Tax=Streptomyces minutiscleroticus TaxID=68238 RepID=A0A918NPF7_9ACTN|nr:glutamate--cysteine ligase [Streptomyces minutiscleroticus]GGX85428.1 putative glutamate--cysteine ligase 2 [Streptomyces minutiscleroticus]